jgi:hypothetical protein
MSPASRSVNDYAAFATWLGARGIIDAQLGQMTRQHPAARLGI